MSLIMHFNAFRIYFHLPKIIIFMRGRYEMAEEEAEGFQQAQLINEDNYIIVKNLEEGQSPLNSTSNNRLPKAKRRFLIKQKPKIKFAALELLPLSSHKKGDSEKLMKSMSLQKTVYDEISKQHLPPARPERREGKAETDRGRAQSVQEIIEAAVIKTKREQIGEDLIIRTDENQQLQKMKQSLSTGQLINIIYKKRAMKSTHDVFKDIAKYAPSSFMTSKYNSVLKAKMGKWQVKPEQTPIRFTGEVSFEAGGESCNLQYVTKDASGEYNLMLSVDTNTRGHQSWFYFTIINNITEKQNIIINICNMKRKFPMIRNGQGIYKRISGLQWQRIEEVYIQPTDKGKNKLSFELELSESQRVEVSLIPPYTYSDQLREIQSYEASPNARVQILTYSLSGLAIPMITITKGARSSNQPNKNRNLYLITARIHPSQTCSSYIVNSLIKQLLTDPQFGDFLKQNVVKVIPMVNPDGVVFGNFRTNYLGADLNRSFHINDEALYPQTIALKELGRKCKEDYGANFLGLLDFHGHSSQPNSFIYGPEYPPATENYVQCRILPKILDKVSSIFSYASSSFRLEEYKNNTARGFFFRKLKVPAYTIQTSYALYSPKGNDEDGNYAPLGISQWEQFGRAILGALKINQQCMSLSQDQKEAKKLGNSENISKVRAKSNYKIEPNSIFARLAQSKATYAKLKREIMQELKSQAQIQKKSQHKEENESESDGENLEEDLSPQQQSLVIMKLNETARGKYLLPRVMKEPVASPSPSPSPSPSLIPTFYIGSEGRDGTLQAMNPKFRNKRYNRPVNISQEYTEYLLRNITGISSLKPQIVSFNPKISKPTYAKNNDG